MELIPRKFYLDDFFDNFNAKNDMKCDIYEKDGDYHINVQAPGFSKEDIKVELKDGYLTITATKENKEEENNKNYIRREISTSSCERSFYLGDVDTDKIAATYKDGILNIIVPKTETVENKKIIEIKQA